MRKRNERERETKREVEREREREALRSQSFVTTHRDKLLIER